MVINIQSILPPLIIPLTWLPKKAKPQWFSTVALNKLYMGLGFVLRILIGNMLPKSFLVPKIIPTTKLFHESYRSRPQTVFQLLQLHLQNCCCTQN